MKYDPQNMIHGFSLVVALVIGGYFAHTLAKRDEFKLKNLSEILVTTFISGVIGARLLYFLLYRDQFVSYVELFKIWEGGLVSYGGFVIGGVALWLCLKLRKEEVLKWLDYLSLGFLVGLFIGRLGDYFSGEINGHFFYFPVTLFESFYTLIILLISAIFWSRSKKKTGLNFLLIIGLYSLFRFIVDFGRGEGKVYSQISFGQFFSLLLFIISLLSFMAIMKSERKEQNDKIRKGVPGETKGNSP